MKALFVTALGSMTFAPVLFLVATVSATPAYACSEEDDCDWDECSFYCEIPDGCTLWYDSDLDRCVLY